ncbi:MAG: hypothetical protein QM773_21335 [Hyphomonadaceae bacterium]
MATGSLSLGGTLNVSLVDNFTPSAGQSFNLFDWSSLSGAFAQVQLPTLNGLFWDTSRLYEDGTLKVVASSEADFNLDADVDADDLAAWKANYGNSPTTRLLKAMPMPMVGHRRRRFSYLAETIWKCSDNRFDYGCGP